MRPRVCTRFLPVPWEMSPKVQLYNIGHEFWELWPSHDESHSPFLPLFFFSFEILLFTEKGVAKGFPKGEWGDQCLRCAASVDTPHDHHPEDGALLLAPTLVNPFQLKTIVRMLLVSWVSQPDRSPFSFFFFFSKLTGLV